MLRLSGTQTIENVNIAVTDSEMHKALCRRLLDTHIPWKELCIHDGKICRMIDMSYHGSPWYEYTPIECQDLKSYSLLKDLEEVLKNENGFMEGF